LALEVEARHRPTLKLCLKTRSDRIVITAGRLAEHLRAAGDMTDLVRLDGDSIREVFVAAAEEAPGEGAAQASVRRASI